MAEKARRQGDGIIARAAIRSRFVQARFRRSAGEYADIRELERGARRSNGPGPQIVFHIAAQSLVRPSYRDPVETYATNVMGTVHLLEAVHETRSRQRPSSSSPATSATRTSEWPWAYRENEPLGGHDPYSSSKGCAELVDRAPTGRRFSRRRTAAVSDRQRPRRQCHRRRRLGGGPADSRHHAALSPAIARSRSASPHAIRPWQHVLEPLSGYCAGRAPGAPEAYSPRPGISARPKKIARPVVL